LAREGLGIVAAFATLHSDNKQALSKRKEVCACRAVTTIIPLVMAEIEKRKIFWEQSR
jgi:hypothetical protein